MSEAGQPIWPTLPEDRRRTVLRVLSQIALRRGGRTMLSAGESNDERRGLQHDDPTGCVGQNPTTAPRAIGDGVYPAVDDAAGRTAPGIDSAAIRSG